jgi:hypothetical protein
MVKTALFVAVGTVVGILGVGACLAAERAPSGTTDTNATSPMASKGCYARRLVNRPGEPLPWIHLDEGQTAYEVRGTFATLLCKNGKLVEVSPVGS